MGGVRTMTHDAPLVQDRNVTGDFPGDSLSNRRKTVWPVGHHAICDLERLQSAFSRMLEDSEHKLNCSCEKPNGAMALLHCMLGRSSCAAWRRARPSSEHGEGACPVWHLSITLCHNASARGNRTIAPLRFNTGISFTWMGNHVSAGIVLKPFLEMCLLSPCTVMQTEHSSWPHEEPANGAELSFRATKLERLPSRRDSREHRVLRPKGLNPAP